MNPFEDFLELMKRDRSYRRFDASKPVGADVLREITSVVRYCGSGRNLQPLRYRLVASPEECDAVFPLLAWAGYLPDWAGPVEAERPMAYIVQCLDTGLTESLLCDDGLHIQTITLAAVAKGLGCCVIKAFNAPALAEALHLPEGMKPLYVIAVGHPVEKVVIEDMRDGNVKYYRDAEGVHHVPKRSVNELIITD